MRELFGLSKKELVALGGFGTGIAITVAGVRSDGFSFRADNPLPPYFSETVESESTLKYPLVIDGEKKYYVYDYIFRGTQFRRELKELKSKKSPNYQILKAAYESQLKTSHGVEYVDGDGKVFDPHVGDFFSVDDPDKINPGVVLREGLTVDINPQTDYLSVFDGDVVRIIGEQEEALGYDHEAHHEISKPVYRVAIVFQNSQIGPDVGKTGYLSREFLGNPYDPYPQAGR